MCKKHPLPFCVNSTENFVLKAAVCRREIATIVELYDLNREFEGERDRLIRRIGIDIEENH